MVFCNIKYIASPAFGAISHNPYFSRWFSAMELHPIPLIKCYCHNPYFSRWFSAISLFEIVVFKQKMSQSLF